MKTAAVILSLLALACCAPPAPRAIPVVPTVSAPRPSKPVDLGPVKRDIGPVVESNRQLYQRILEGKQSIYELNRKLRSLEASRAATQEEWQRLTELGTATARSLEESEKIQADQRQAIEALETTVAYKGIEVAEAEAEKLALRDSLEEANGRIGSITAAHNQAADAAARASRDTANLKGQRKVLLIALLAALTAAGLLFWLNSINPLAFLRR